MIKDCIKAVEMFNAGTIDEDTAMLYLYEYDDCHDTIIFCDKECRHITRLYLVNQDMEEVRTVWARNKRATVTTCINAATAYNEGTITEDEMLHALSDYDHCHKTMMLYDTTLGKVTRLYLVDENVITVKTVWRSEWPDNYKPLKLFEVIRHIRNFGRVSSSLTYALNNKELFKLLDAYNDTHKTQLIVQINSLDTYQCSEVHITLYCTRRVGDRNRTDKIMTWRVYVH